MAKNDRHYCVCCRSKQYEKYMHEVYVNNICKRYWICWDCCRNNPPTSTIMKKPSQTYNPTTGKYLTVPGVSSEEDNFSTDR